MTPDGPHPIGQKRQVALPKAVMDAVALQPGDQVWFEVADDHIRLFPAEVVASIWEKGQRLAAEQRKPPPYDGGPDRGRRGTGPDR